MLHSHQIEYLQKKFHLKTISKMDDLSGLQPVHELLDPEHCSQYLKEISKEFHTSSLLATASQFSKRYAYLLVPPVLYAMSIYHKELRVSPQNSYLEPAYRQKNWFPRLVLMNYQGDSPTMNRTLWRDQVLKRLFADHLAKIWKTLHECTGIPLIILWENTSLYIHWTYRNHLLSLGESAVEDYQYLTQEADLSVFDAPFQPLQRFQQIDGCRKTCCLYFLTNEQKELCKGCPRAKIRQVKSQAVVSSL